MKTKKILSLFLLLFTLSFSEQFTIGFFHMRTAKTEGPFWNKFTILMQKAADDLGIKLKIYYANEDPLVMTEQLEKAARKHEVDVLLFQNYSNRAIQFLRIAEMNKMPAFLVNSGIDDKKLQIKPRTKYPYFIGQMLPHDSWAGYTLAKHLYNEALKNKTSTTYQNNYILAFSGNEGDGSAINRLNGLEQFLKETPDLHLFKIINADWQPDKAVNRLAMLKKSLPKISIIWSANDQMVVGKKVNNSFKQGLLYSVKKYYRNPGKDIFLGGINWTSEAISAIKKGEVSASLGGHFIEGAWAVVVLFDYLNGIDFATENTQFNTKLQLITKENVHLYENLDKLFSRDNLNKIDFKKYSKKYNPNLTKYSFDLDQLIKQLNK